LTIEREELNMVVLANTKQAAAAKTSLTYLTIGALVIVWTVIWYLYLRNNGAAENTYLWVYGFLATGVVLLIIGFAVGQIGRSAMPAETAPTAAVTGVVPAATGMAAPVAAPNTTAPAGQQNAAMPPAGSGQQVVNKGTTPPAAAAPSQARRT
jgi:hypothetical protein